MTLTEEQSGFLSILRETGFIRRDQVLPLLRLHTPKKTAEQAEGLLRRLAYLGRLVRLPDGTLALLELREGLPDAARLLALDILLALAPAKLLQVSAPRPYALCFLLERQDGWLDHFAVMPIPVGHEARVSQLLEAEPRNYVFLLALEHMEQYRELRLTRSHYFVLRQDGRLRFYKGGEAGR